ncbi:cell division protein FtsQ/DivIB [Lactobacillus laiwuensis]|uniref:cell division protein FtsQ/DivIB n=1 Tax=Lactobacillus laiwuensis TaxID=2841034 RepID=UPI001CC52401|nr:cell division protein FtsQ/DivIB [Lactobacillus laiwuensis]
MTKKRVTKIDPKEKLSPYLDHETNQKKKSKAKAKVSASLSKLHSERKSALFKRLGLVVGISVLAILGLGYYISPLANVKSIQIKGENDLPIREVVKTADIKASDKVIDHLFNKNSIDHKLSSRYSEIKNINVHVKNFNNLVLNIDEYHTIGYVKNAKGYRKILSQGKLGTQVIPWSKVSPDKPVFVGYNHELSLQETLHLFNSLPANFQSQIKLLSGNTRRKSQVIFLMKNGNVVIGNVSTLKSKLKYYNKIKTKVGKNTLIDLEVGAFSRPLTPSEKRAYGLT